MCKKYSGPYDEIFYYIRNNIEDVRDDLELMDKYDELLLTNQNLGYIYSLAKESEKMLKSTLAGDVETVCKIEVV